ncbi:MAG: DUF1566 domain-containing protein [Parabacteroides sp.]|nr:DUF1566 domain-containing protein [Parabacteroides sp.]
MKRSLLLILLAGLIAPAGLYAQKVYKNGNKVILDLTEDAGMPKGSVTTTSKTSLYASYTHTAGELVGEAENTVNNPINLTVYQKLEVLPYDMNINGEITGTNNATDQTNSMSMKWSVAFDGCKNLSYGGNNDWRLPTQRELILMCIFKPALESFFNEPFNSTAQYWSATEGSDDFAWAIRMSDGLLSSVRTMNSGTRARCVREVTN